MDWAKRASICGEIMKITKLVLIALTMSSSALAESGFLDRSVALKGQTYRYQVYIPVDYVTTKKWPIIACLHGAGQQGNDGLLPTRGDLSDNIRRNRSLFPAIIVFPQAQMGTRWLDLDMQELAIAELDQAIKEFQVDSKRVYLTGFSMGAGGTYRIAYRWPEKFTAIVTVAGFIETPPASMNSPAGMEADRRANVFVDAPDPFAALASRLKNIPIWIFHGDADSVVPVNQSRKLSQALKDTGANVHYTEYPGASHGVASQKAYADPEMIKWLLQQSH
jgi:predicted peptidase